MEETFIAKIEGHGRLKVDWKQNRVVLEVTESERLFEGIVVGRPAEEAPWITARICGVCPTAHNLCAFKALEQALGIVPDEITVLLRRLHLDAQMLQSHALHLYFLSLPDYLGIDSGLELKEKHPHHFQAALKLKEVSDKIAEVVGGRSTHPTRTTLGGYHKLPTPTEIKELRKDLKGALAAAEQTVNLATELKYPPLKSKLLFLSQVGEGKIYHIYESSRVKASDGTSWEAKDYKKQITEELRESSTAKFGFYQGRSAMVGALARLALQKEGLKGKAKKHLSQIKIDFENPFHNNLAQALEILHFTEEALLIVEEFLDGGLKGSKIVTQIKVSKPARGV
ncbi:MAG: nickel-dependent hydrogenase large subunit, partial [candidate division WWE3 bacterium]|nr:nickel-dependent hydrogenase large subunit [candidate division WWE3 bacterium]